MITIPCKQTTFFDVDDTLVSWNASQEDLEARGIWIQCPGSMIDIDNDGEVQYAAPWAERLLPHRKHIEQLKKHKMRGHTIIVWSQGGYDWAAAVVRALNLHIYVDLVISKPTWIYDDIQPTEFMPKPYWYKDE